MGADGAPSACESCGAPAEDLRPVRRVYLDRGPDGTLRAAVTETPAAAERWCPACRAQYPHDPADG